MAGAAGRTTRGSDTAFAGTVRTTIAADLVDGLECAAGAGSGAGAPFELVGSGAGFAAEATTGQSKAPTARRSGIEHRGSKADERRAICDHLRRCCSYTHAPYACRSRRSTVKTPGRIPRDPPQLHESGGLDHPLPGQRPVEGSAT
jgi:hypothetical protein